MKNVSIITVMMMFWAAVASATTLTITIPDPVAQEVGAAMYERYGRRFPKLSEAETDLAWTKRFIIDMLKSNYVESQARDAAAADRAAAEAAAEAARIQAETDANIN